jgi:hypothetical protein
MTVIKPNSVAGINSITVQSGEALSVHKSDGTLIRTITSSSGVSTFTSASVGAATTDNNADASINVGLGASISQHATNSLSLGTGGNERLRITSGGLIGVNNNTPLYALHFKNAMGSTPSFIHMEATGSNTVGGGGGIQFDTSASNSSSNNTLYLATIAGIRNSLDDGSNDLVFSTSKNGVNSNLPVERLRINSSGDVGIGTDTMNAPLTVVNHDNAGYIASFRQKHASNSAQIIIDSPSDSNVRPSSIDLAQGGTVKWSLGQAYSSTSSQAFHIATSALQANENGSKLTITTAGSVGIGTAVPGQSLEVFKQSGTNLVKVSTQANSTIGIELQKTGSTTQSWRIADGQTVNGALEIYDVTDSATRLLINGSGKFCFGTYNSGFANNDSVANFVNAASAGTENPLLTLWNPTTAGDARASIDFLTNDNSGTGRDGAFIRASNDGVTAKAHLQFGTIKDETYAELIRFQSTGGISFNGDTAEANALDDYEEGTFTPTNTIGLTLTNNNPAYYIKIGKLVMVQFDVSFSGASDTAQCGMIQSLPFTSENTTDHFSQGPLPHISTNSNFDLDTSLDDLLLFVGPNESRIDIFSFSINTTAARSSLVGRRIRHQMIYKAA